MSYVKQNFVDGNPLYADELNHIEQGIVDVEENVDNMKTEIPANVVQYTTQTLTEEQKAQARANIGAISSTHVTNYTIGKNIFNIATITENMRLDDNGNFVALDGSCVTDYIPVEAGLNYVFSCITDATTGTRGVFTNRRVIGYDENKNFVTLIGTYVKSFYTTDANIKYIRVQMEMAKANADAQLELAADTNFITDYEPYTLKEVVDTIDISNLSMNDLIMKFRVQGFSDMTIIDGDIWGFCQSTDGGAVFDGDIQIYRIDFENKTAQIIRRIHHNFGHCNSVDYCAETDCLIFGNGSGSYTLEGKFYVIKNPKQMLLAPKLSASDSYSKLSLTDYVIEYDCSALGWGVKMNALWGHSNNNRFDMVLLITKDNAEIRLVQLGKGSNNLGLGTMIANTADDDFNGTFKLLNTYTLDDGRTSEFNSDNCNQGSDWFNGRLYLGIGHDIIRYWVVTLLNDGTAKYEDICEPNYNAAGEKLTGASEGIIVTRDLFMLQIVENGNEYVNVYKR